MAIASLQESILSEAVMVDEEAGVIRGVKILGKVSRNKREYSDRALDDAVRLYEGQVVNLDHDRKEPTRERGFMEGTGVLTNIRREKDAVYGDLNILKSHPYAPVIFESAKRFPAKFGLSHNAEGESKLTKNSQVVESLTRVRSVDLVRNPATNSGLFESENPTVKKSLKSILESQFPGNSLACPLLESGSLPAMEVELPEDATNESAFRVAMVQAVESLATDEKTPVKDLVGNLAAIFESLHKIGTPAKTNEDPAKPLETILESFMGKVNEKFAALETKLAEAAKPQPKARPFMESVNQAGDGSYPKDHAGFIGSIKR